MFGNNHMTFEEDLEFIADKAATALNIFNETVSRDNKLVTMYGQDEFIALILTPYEINPFGPNDDGQWGTLRLRTKDMAATWNNVPAGFSQINESRGLLADMRRAAKVSLKRNSVWYIDRQMQDAIGDRVVFTELTTNKGYLYKVAFTNGFITYISIVRDDKEYNKPHDVAKLYFIASKTKEPISPPMTADECIMMLINVAMQTDMKISEFISLAEQCGGRTTISHSYRTEDESVDEAKAVFANGFAMKLRVENENINAEIVGRYENKSYVLDSKTFESIEDVYDAVRHLSQMEEFKPDFDDEDEEDDETSLM